VLEAEARVVAALGEDAGAISPLRVLQLYLERLGCDVMVRFMRYFSIFVLGSKISDSTSTSILTRLSLDQSFSYRVCKSVSSFT
jgi:hypothetical protein